MTQERFRSVVEKRSQKSGLSPGTLVHIGEKKSEETKLSVLSYSRTEYDYKDVKGIEEIEIDESKVTWINIVGLHDTSLIEKIGKRFGLHPLLLEDIVNTSQRPKMEDYKDYLFIVMKMLHYFKEEDEVHSEQISIILGSNLIITFQEEEKDCFDNLRTRIRKKKGIVTQKKADYLTYSLMDAIVDDYFSILEEVGEDIEILEHEVINKPRDNTLQTLHELKREIIFLRRFIIPLRELARNFQNENTTLVGESTKLYFRDVYDHVTQILDTVEIYREMLSGILDLYLSLTNNKMNETMKVLTLISTIFIPLSFVVGVYGMNFKHMPELNWHLGYPLIWIIMITIATTFVTFFRRKGWV